MPHPATMFFLLTLAVILLSWIFDVYGLSVLQPQTGEVIRVQSLLSPEGIRWLLRHVITNFTGFAPLGLVIVAMFGIGVAQHSAHYSAGYCLRTVVQYSGRCRIYHSVADSCNFVPVRRSAPHWRYNYSLCFSLLWL